MASIMSLEGIQDTDVSDFNIIRGRFDTVKVREYLEQIFTATELASMKAEGVDQRMMFGINPHYHALVMGGGLTLRDGTEILPNMPPSRALLALVMPRLEEVADLSGQSDPSHQMQYSPKHLKGKILHKYDEIVLGYAARACSSHCRYCYRLDLFNQSTGKGLVKPEELRDYIQGYNTWVEEIRGIDPVSGAKRYPIREALLSGGDPMVLRNEQLYRYFIAAAEAGVTIVRVGTKEVAFRPERFDPHFVNMLNKFHAQYPGVHINFVTHYSHPDEFLFRDERGHYIAEAHGYRWLDVAQQAVKRLTSLGFVTLENQTPMISLVNDNVEVLHLLHEELRRMSVKPKYIFQNREIEGHKAFAVPVEEAWRIHTASQRGLSDTARSRFVMSTEWGKLEVVSVIDGLSEAGLSILPAEIRRPLQVALGDGLIVFKVYRSPFSAETQGALVIAKRNPEAVWISGYEDRILYDGRIPSGNKYKQII